MEELCYAAFVEKYLDSKARPADRIREHVRSAYIEPALRRGDPTVAILAGDIVRDLHLTNRIPSVCAALRSWALLNENHLSIEKDEGPPSGQSTTVKITYRLPVAGSSLENAKAAALARWDAVRGVGREMYAQLGGGEAFLKAEREAWGE